MTPRDVLSAGHAMRDGAFERRLAGFSDRPHGRIALANTDLAGANDHRNSIREADRAVKQVL